MWNRVRTLLPGRLTDGRATFLGIPLFPSRFGIQLDLFDPRWTLFSRRTRNAIAGLGRALHAGWLAIRRTLIPGTLGARSRSVQRSVWTDRRRTAHGHTFDAGVGKRRGGHRALLRWSVVRSEGVHTYTLSFSLRTFPGRLRGVAGSIGSGALSFSRMIRRAASMLASTSPSTSPSPLSIGTSGTSLRAHERTTL